MPTTAVTGTRQASTAGKPKDEAPVEDFTSVQPVAASDHPAVDLVDPSGDGFPELVPHPPAPSGDLNGNGLTQVATRDGKHVNVDAGQKGWEKLVKDA